mmetsp:Transcript_12532/g.22762  ORF Transcript_12532/g.22762 Transcript_12532/m.22762 type:complete len:268 (-) Transcript_12532:74-877(-)
MDQYELKNAIFPGNDGGEDPLLSSSNDLPWHQGGDDTMGAFQSYEYQDSTTAMGGSIGGSIGGTIGGGEGVKQRTSSTQMSGQSSYYATGDDQIDFENEPPLLEELGINFNHIMQKTLAVLIPTKTLHQEIMADTDMAGPLCFCLLLGFCLLLTGKIHFGYIYGFGLIGCLGMYIILNLMSSKFIDFYRTMSILGYCLLPIVSLAASSIVFSLKGHLGFWAAVVSILWCTVAATRFIEATLDMRPQRYLVAYPLMLLYSCFALITVF